MHRPTRIATGALCLASMISIALPAIAAQPGQKAGDIVSTARDPGEELRTAVVRYDDLNLLNDSGVNRLTGRVERAADRVCAAFDQRMLVAFIEAQSCYRATMTVATHDIELAVARVRNGERHAMLGKGGLIRISRR